MVDLDGPSGGGAIGEASDGGGAGVGATGGGAGGGASGGETCSFFRKPSKSRNIRKRGAPASPTSSDDAPSLPSQKPKKTPNPDNKLHFSSARPAADSSSSDPDPTLFRFESSAEIQVHHDSRATATLETETDFSHDARALRERSLKQSAASLTANPTSTSADPKLYKGMNNYTDYKAGFRREQTVAGEKASGAHGPLRASAHIRMSARFDYQPDICKDYKETGYCGFGDACKFMHDRGDYKSGWQMDKEWEEKEKARKRKLAMKGGDDDEGGGGEEEEEDDEDEEGLPFACFICRQSFVDPVVTKCKHYFCEHCALKHHSKNKKCFVCNKPTLGIFNTAQEIKKRTAKEK